MNIARHFAVLLFTASLLMVRTGAVAAQEIGPSSSANLSSSKTTLRLDDVVREALEKNPEAQSALHTVRALERRIPQAQALPDPVASVGWAGRLAPFDIMSGDASSNRGVTVSEQFPYPGKLKLQGAIASKEAEAARADYEAVRRQVTADVKTAYYDYFYYDKAIQTTRKNKELLEKLSAIAEAQYRVGKAMQQDVLRSQVEVTLLDEKLTVLEQQRSTAQARINTYLLRSPESALPPTSEVASSPLRYSLDELNTFAAKNDTGVLRNKRMVERGQLSMTLAEKLYKPDFGVAYMYQQRAAQPDMHGLTFSVNIPVFYRSKQRQGVAEAAENLLSAERMRDNRLNEVRFELKQQYLAAQAAEKLVNLYSKGVVPQSSLALESAMSSYQVGKVDFLSLIANFTTLLDYETDYYRQLADYQTAIARMESLTGVEVAGASDQSSGQLMPAPVKKESDRSLPGTERNENHDRD